MIVFDDSPAPKAGLGNLYDCPFFRRVAATPPLPRRRRTIVYVDGFNLYYGAIKPTPALKWLNIARSCELLRPHDDLRLIRYFSALINGPTKPNQDTYLKALTTTPLVDIILGEFKRKTLRCEVAACTAAGPRLYDTHEEKRTDVNIAIFMLDDAYRDLCDQFVIFSGDSDLVPAVNMIRLRFNQKRIVVYVPSRNPTRGAAVELRTAAHVHKTLPLHLLPLAQFPNPLPDGASGFLHRPATWV